MISRPDLLDARSPRGIEVYQLTGDPDLPSCHLYMEAQIFAPDSRRFLLHRSAHPHDSDRRDPRHRYELCDLDAGGTLRPVTDELGACAPSVTPDGRAFYYFVDETVVNGGRLTLKRAALDGSGRETVLALDAPLPGTTFRPSWIYPLSTISSDGARLAVSCYLGDGNTPDAPWGLLVFDLQAATVALILAGPSWCNIHPQYCRSREPEAASDILVQENHGNHCDAQGEITELISGPGADIHIVRDDGSRFRNLPWGRDGNEQCQGHQCWIGRSRTAITSTVTKVPDEFQLIAGSEASHTGHAGIASPRGRRNDLSRLYPTPRFSHFATDIAGTRFVTDHFPLDGTQAICCAALPADPLREPIPAFTYLLDPRSAVFEGSHIHPFLSPDGKTAFFNSSESGTLQAYMITGLDEVWG